MQTCLHLYTMAYEYTYSFPAEGGKGRQGYLFPSPILFSQIFSGSPQFYVGSVITVEEILLILSNVIIGSEKFVDVDHRWFEPKRYFGTFQVKAGLSSEYDAEEGKGEGFLTNNAHQIVRYSTYTIVANPDKPLTAGSVFTVDNCNFGTQEIGLTILGVEVKASKPIVDKALFSGTVSEQRAPLRDTVYNSLLGEVGLYYNPGCEGVSLTQKISVINTIATDYDDYPTFACVPLGG